MGSHPVPYDFGPFLDARGGDWSDDSLLLAWLTHRGVDEEALAWVQAIGRRAATVWSDLADFVERPENLPRLAGKGPYDNDPQQVVLPAETWDMLAEVHGSGIWSGDERAKYAAVYLLNQNGEHGVACSIACTDGLQRALAVHGGDRGQPILDALTDATPDDWVHGAQFVTEIQGGSDAGANAVEARPQDDGEYAFHGQKWFCSNLTADWWLVTARPTDAPGGSRGVGLFCVPRDQPGYTVERLKDKLGTRALPTAEIVFHGARGWPVGPLDSGLRTMVEHVLVTSRIHNIVAAAGFLRRAVREAEAYTAYREAFGQRLADIPLLADRIQALRGAADAAAAGAFATVDAWLHASGDASEDERTWARVLVSLHKAVSTRRLPGLVHEAMMMLGGNGVEERFTPLPRLWRDAAILETWEGPYTLLLDQAWRDMRRLAGDRIEAVLAAGLDDAAADLAKRAAAALDGDAPGPPWRALAHDIIDAFEARALRHLRPG